MRPFFAANSKYFSIKRKKMIRKKDHLSLLHFSVRFRAGARRHLSNKKYLCGFISFEHCVKCNSRTDHAFYVGGIMSFDFISLSVSHATMSYRPQNFTLT